jgi:radical SAM/Cys-rich protein
MHGDDLLTTVPLKEALDFDAALAAAGCRPLRTGEVETLQLNLGRLCNLSCRHCHLEAGPERGQELMSEEVLTACLGLLDRLGAATVDLTGGAPELHPRFRALVDALIARGVRVIDRCNLAVLLLTDQADLPEWLAERGVEIVASLPCYLEENVDGQRGAGAFAASVVALRELKAAGYGQGDPARVLTLAVNPLGDYLPPAQADLEDVFREELAGRHGVTFDRLVTMTNMPIGRFGRWLESEGQGQSYWELLIDSFNPACVEGLMCRHTLSVSWEGRLFDCDFNQALGQEIDWGPQGRVPLEAVTAAHLRRRPVRTGPHCFGCTAGFGSSCQGATCPEGPGESLEVGER